MSESLGYIFFILFALIVGVAITQILGKLKNIIPYSIVIFLIGFLLSFLSRHEEGGLLGHSINQWSSMDPELILYVLLPPLVFGDAMFLNWFHVTHGFQQAAILAGPGVVLSTFIMGAFMKGLTPDWAFNICFLFGAILSATDTAAVLAILKEANVSSKLNTLIVGESLLNDGTAIVMFQLFFDLSKGLDYSASDIVLFFLNSLLGSVAFGCASGLIMVRWMQTNKKRYKPVDGMIQNLITLSCSYMVFYVAQHIFHQSGVLACCSAGLMIAWRGPPVILNHHTMQETWEMIVWLGNSSIFLLGGLIYGSRAIDYIHPQDWLYVMALYGLLIVTRFVVCTTLYPFIYVTGYKFSWREMAFVIWTSERGALAMALALLVEAPGVNIADESLRSKLFFYIGGISSLALTINGMTGAFVLKKLKLTADKNSFGEKVVFKQIQKRIRHKLNKQLERNRHIFHSSLDVLYPMKATLQDFKQVSALFRDKTNNNTNDIKASEYRAAGSPQSQDNHMMPYGNLSPVSEETLNQPLPNLRELSKSRLKKQMKSEKSDQLIDRLLLTHQDSQLSIQMYNNQGIHVTRHLSHYQYATHHVMSDGAVHTGHNGTKSERTLISEDPSFRSVHSAHTTDSDAQRRWKSMDETHTTGHIVHIDKEEDHHHHIETDITHEAQVALKISREDEHEHEHDHDTDEEKDQVGDTIHNKTKKKGEMEMEMEDNTHSRHTHQTHHGHPHHHHTHNTQHNDDDDTTPHHASLPNLSVPPSSPTEATATTTTTTGGGEPSPINISPTQQSERSSTGLIGVGRSVAISDATMILPQIEIREEIIPSLLHYYRASFLRALSVHYHHEVEIGKIPFRSYTANLLTYSVEVGLDSIFTLATTTIKKLSMEEISSLLSTTCALQEDWICLEKELDTQLQRLAYLKYYVDLFDPYNLFPNVINLKQIYDDAFEFVEMLAVYALTSFIEAHEHAQVKFHVYADYHIFEGEQDLEGHLSDHGGHSFHGLNQSHPHFFNEDNFTPEEVFVKRASVAAVQRAKERLSTFKKETIVFIREAQAKRMILAQQNKLVTDMLLEGLITNLQADQFFDQIEKDKRKTRRAPRSSLKQT